MRGLSEEEISALKETGRVAGEIAAGVRGAAILSSPWLLRLIAVVVGVGGAIMCFDRAWPAYGGTAEAAIPAVMMSITPLVVFQMVGLGWGGLVLAGLGSVGLGWLVEQLSPLYRDLLVVVVLVVIFLSYMLRHEEGAQDEGE